jgi:hypothetical protein
MKIKNKRKEQMSIKMIIIRIMIFGICHKIKDRTKRKNNLFKIQDYGLIRKILDKVCLLQKAEDEEFFNLYENFTINK